MNDINNEDIVVKVVGISAPPIDLTKENLDPDPESVIYNGENFFEDVPVKKYKNLLWCRSQLPILALSKAYEASSQVFDNEEEFLKYIGKKGILTHSITKRIDNGKISFRAFTKNELIPNKWNYLELSRFDYFVFCYIWGWGLKKTLPTIIRNLGQFYFKMRGL